ncbi:MAG: hypothetical protein CVU27_08715 [Betaproteobacteria bacterium HGW-Betaproteobacteria-20]|nr:MAG: hypothetical protein CVU27_08715 [Betaproteobacteria bacterium HGW-Betaproteobacteria-20]
MLIGNHVLSIFSLRLTGFSTQNECQINYTLRLFFNLLILMVIITSAKLYYVLLRTLTQHYRAKNGVCTTIFAYRHRYWLC